MGRTDHKFLVVYDITSDRERIRVDRLLQQWGLRIQKSVFEVHATRRECETLCNQLADIQPITGHVRMFMLEPQGKRRAWGDVPIENSQLFYLV